MKPVLALIESLKTFEDRTIRAYTRLAAEWRDQRLAEGASGEAAFWNTIVALCIEERQRRSAEIRRLEAMYRTGRDPEARRDWPRSSDSPSPCALRLRAFSSSEHGEAC
ncbi:MAG: hypothetical protein D6690_16875 [Nitrospirae bacterium]|nr:MAG: hypothetical protein D6690_16875 [Nitrospirota bacterium]